MSVADQEFDVVADFQLPSMAKLGYLSDQPMALESRFQSSVAGSHRLLYSLIVEGYKELHLPQ